VRSGLAVASPENPDAKERWLFGSKFGEIVADCRATGSSSDHAIEIGFEEVCVRGDMGGQKIFSNAALPAGPALAATSQNWRF